MVLTIGNWILVGIVGIIGIGISIYLYVDSFCHGKRNALINFGVTLLVCIGLVCVINWYNTSTASGIRGYKDFKSEMANGIDREIVITAEDGREIFRYEGKIDLDMDNEGNYLRFETQDGKRYTIEYGVQDSVIIIEK